MRRLVDDAQPNDPLHKEKELPAIEVVISLAEKDLRSVNLAIQGCIENSRNLIAKISVVVPDSLENLVRQSLPEANVLVESEVLPAHIRRSISANHPEGREGWIKQQAIGIVLARESEYCGVLVLDSDTIFIRPLTFLGSGSVQLLQFSHEYEEPYETHAERMWGKRRTHLGLSYVTHYQLMQPAILNEMFPDLDSVAKWLRLGDSNLRSPIADYHSYGRFLADNFGEKYVLGRWGNKSISWDLLRSDSRKSVSALSNLFPEYYSVSVHEYLGSRAVPSEGGET